jgi:hypothetical protein
MNRLERINDPEAAMRTVLLGWQAGLYTALPAVIESFNPNAMTCEAVVALQARVTAQDGSQSWVTLPKLVDVPVVFPGGGGYTLTFPITAGDEALIVFSNRCIDLWWLAGGVQQCPDLRMHDLSDGLAFVGVRSQPRVVTGGVKAGATQLRSDDGSTFVELAGTGVNIKAPGGINLNGATIDATGNITAPTVNGTIDVIFAGKSGKGHTHSGVVPGSGNSGAPV